MTALDALLTRSATTRSATIPLMYSAKSRLSSRRVIDSMSHFLAKVRASMSPNRDDMPATMMRIPRKVCSSN